MHPIFNFLTKKTNGYKDSHYVEFSKYLINSNGMLEKLYLHGQLYLMVLIWIEENEKKWSIKTKHLRSCRGAKRLEYNEQFLLFT